VHLNHVAVLVEDVVGDVGDGRDDAHVELAVEALLHDVHVEQPKEAATEAEAKGDTRFGREREAGIVQLQFLQRRPQVLKVLCLNGIYASKHHRLHLFETGHGLVAGTRHRRNRIAHLDLGGGLNAGDDVAHVAAMQLLFGHEVHAQHAHLVGNVALLGVHENDLFALLDGAVANLEIGDNSAKRIEDAVENHGLQRGFFVALGRRDAFDDGAQDFVDAFAGASRRANDFLAFAAEEFDDFVLHLLGAGIDHVAFGEHGDDFQVVLNGHVEIADGLRLYALRGVDEQEAAFASGNAARHFVGEVDVSRRVDEVEHVGFAVERILHLDGVALDGDAALTFQIHVVEHLPLGDLDGLRALKQAVGQGGFAVVDVRNYTKVSDVPHIRIFRRRQKRRRASNLSPKAALRRGL